MSELTDKIYARNLEIARDQKNREKARNTIKKYNTGRHKGKAKNIIQNTKNIAKQARSPWSLFSLFFQMSFMDWMYWLAILAAAFKDIIDFFLIGSMPGIGTVITFCISIFIAMMMLLGSFTNGVGRMHQKIIRSYLILIMGTGAEMLFGLNFFPIETVVACFVYILMLADRKAQEEVKKEEKRQAQRELQYEY